MEKNSSVFLPIAFIVLFFVLVGLTPIFGENIEVIEEPIDETETTENIDVLTPSSDFDSTPIYDNLSFILENVFYHTRINGITSINEAVKINGNILDYDKYKNEFAFQYGFANKYVDYLGDEYTGETGAYSVTEINFNTLHEMIYGEQGMIDRSIFKDVCYNSEVFTEEDNLKCLDDSTIKYYNSGVFTGYTEDDDYIFKEVNKEALENDLYRVTANIYDCKYHCLKDHDEEYCNDYESIVGRIEIVYETVESIYVFKSISLYEN